jgi:hypothetical protein
MAFCFLQRPCSSLSRRWPRSSSKAARRSGGIVNQFGSNVTLYGATDGAHTDRPGGPWTVQEPYGRSSCVCFIRVPVITVDRQKRHNVDCFADRSTSAMAPLPLPLPNERSGVAAAVIADERMSVLVITVYGDIEVNERAPASGAVACLRKPFDDERCLRTAPYPA